MRSLTASELIDIWGTQSGASISEAAIGMLLRVSSPEESASLQDASLGERDRSLMLLRASMFGSTVEAVTSCPSCGARLDLVFSTTEFLEAVPAAPPLVVERSKDGYTVVFRPVTTGDLSALPGGSDPRDLKRLLLDRCILDARFKDQAITHEDLPADVLAEVSDSMSDLDPLADIQLEASCPECRHKWMVDFDITSYFLMEIEREAKNLLEDVHVIATVYHWTEQDILELHPLRRKFYLEKIMNG